VSALDTGQSLVFVEIILSLPLEKQSRSYPNETVPTAGRSQCASSFVRQFNHLAITLGVALFSV
jgi:hypothetical protein